MNMVMMMMLVVVVAAVITTVATAAQRKRMFDLIKTFHSIFFIEMSENEICTVPRTPHDLAHIIHGIYHLISNMHTIKKRYCIHRYYYCIKYNGEWYCVRVLASERLSFDPSHKICGIFMHPRFIENSNFFSALIRPNWMTTKKQKMHTSDWIHNNILKILNTIYLCAHSISVENGFSIDIFHSMAAKHTHLLSAPQFKFE